MGLLTIILIAISLSFDSFAVSVSGGLTMCRKSLKVTQSLKIAFSLAFFQAIMPLLGFYLGESFDGGLVAVDHWIAFVLLAFLGIRMIREGRIPINKRKIKNPSHWKVLIPMSLATSIDAFAVGISFSFFVDSIYLFVAIVGLVTFLVSMTGLYMGRKIGKKMAGLAEIFGGIILILIGTKILIEHLFIL